MVALAALLAQSAQAAEDLRCFFQAQVLFWMLRAIDGHAKNFSLFLLPGGSYRLTPLYDVLSAWPVIGKAAGQWPEQELRLAMAWHGTKSRTSKPLQVQRRHLISTASRMGLGIEADALVANLVARTPEVIATVQQELPSRYPEPLACAILDGLQGSAAAALARVHGGACTSPLRRHPGPLSLGKAIRAEGGLQIPGCSPGIAGQQPQRSWLGLPPTGHLGVVAPKTPVADFKMLQFLRAQSIGREQLKRIAPVGIRNRLHQRLNFIHRQMEVFGQAPVLAIVHSNMGSRCSRSGGWLLTPTATIT
jgi:hypothetical protein